ncbi:hypothetical protein [Nostoc sp. NMS2]|uniref:hypothetical protein n=1 Tax=Nostoc sp. NMS2 TaxID=2815389 RepID=UPI0025F09582|nr:hypothetical protein [Nostoc sp. NMS2]
MRHETQQIRWVLLRSTQPTKNGEGIEDAQNIKRTALRVHSRLRRETRLQR